MDFKDDKFIKVINQEREVLLQNLINKLTALKEDFYQEHIYTDREGLKRRIDEIYDSYNLEIKYKGVKISEDNKKD